MTKPCACWGAETVSSARFAPPWACSWWPAAAPFKSKGMRNRSARRRRVFTQLRHMLHHQDQLSSENVRTVLEVVRQGGEPLETAGTPPRPSELKSRFVRPRTDGQARYFRAMRDNAMTLCVGPAGTGKTYLAVGMAVSMLRAGEVKKIVLVRPAVEAGERLGFLPGDIVAKVNPYLRPLFDALNDMMEPDAVKRYMDADIIEIVPLAYMRGRTLNNAVIILDEGQNTTVPQMKMFLTRMGEGSRIIVTGDITQIDLPKQMRAVWSMRPTACATSIKSLLCIWTKTISFAIRLFKR